MLLINIHRLRETIHVASPLFLHVFILVAVFVYIIVGAQIIQYLENVHIQRQNEISGFVEKSDTTSSMLNGFRSKRSLRLPRGTFVLSGHEISAISAELFSCVDKVILNAQEWQNDCNVSQSRSNEWAEKSDSLDVNPLSAIDECYRRAKVNPSVILRKAAAHKAEGTSSPSTNEWTFPNALIFAFTVITTIGYGNVTPQTAAGRAFCILYALVGVPLALLVIADIGMFFNRFVRSCAERLDRVRRWWTTQGGFRDQQRRKNDNRVECGSEALSLRCSNGSDTGTLVVREETENVEGAKNLAEVDEEEEECEQERRRKMESVILSLLFVVYLSVGSFVISSYEREMDVFDAVYFNFISLTTIGLGDLVPTRYEFLAITLCYIAVGLALTTMVVEVAADALKQFHYFGSSVEHTAAVDVWFGGKKMKLANLIRHFGDMLNIPTEELDTLDVDQLIQNALSKQQTGGGIAAAATGDGELRNE